jgi:hypothetical protein
LIDIDTAEHRSMTDVPGVDLKDLSQVHEDDLVKRLGTHPKVPRSLIGVWSLA